MRQERSSRILYVYRNRWKNIAKQDPGCLFLARLNMLNKKLSAMISTQIIFINFQTWNEPLKNINVIDQENFRGWCFWILWNSDGQSESDLISNSKKPFFRQEAKWSATDCNEFIIQTFSYCFHPMKKFQYRIW